MKRLLACVCVALSAAACGVGPEEGEGSRLDLGAEPELGELEVPEIGELPDVSSPALKPVVVQGRGEWELPDPTGIDADLSPLVFAATQMVILEMDAGASEGDFEDVTTAGHSVRTLRRRLTDREHEEHGAALGRELWLFDAHQRVCTVTLSDLWRVREEWAEPLEDDGLDAPSREMTAASFIVTEGDCSGALVAGPAQDSTRVFARVGGVDQAESVAIWEAFRALPEYREIQESFAAGDWDGEPKRSLPASWLDYEDGYREISRFATEDGQELVRAWAIAGPGCGGFDGRLFAIWERGKDGLVLRAVGHHEDEPALIVDRDGRLSFSSESSLLVANGQHWQPAFSVLEPWVCPC
ncbi:MAG: hypothetical protein R3B13_15800 [Polyangiaceae bacterium]